MRHLITGGSGFLGKYIYNELKGRSYPVLNIARNNNKIQPQETIYCNLANTVPDLGTASIHKVIHVAGKAHVIPRNKEEEAEFYSINTNGTKNLLTALGQLERLPKVFINISTVAVYGINFGNFISEHYVQDPKTPYGKSKSQAEVAVSEWCMAHGVNYYNLRLPLVFGQNPPGNLRKMINALNKGYYLQIKDNLAKKSIVLAEDVAKLVVRLEDEQSGTYNLTDGYHPTIAEIEEALSTALGKHIRFKLSAALIGNMIKAVSFFKLNGKSNFVEEAYRKMTANLTFSDDSARKHLNWAPRIVLEHLSALNLTNKK